MRGHLLDERADLVLLIRIEAIGRLVQDQDLRIMQQGLGETVRGNGWQVDELRVETGHLDEVFRTITADFNEGART
ncbi:MAG: hypothetical protein USCGTAYLOR_00965 [Chromatiales bacterium USCg_Taylor]|nr:MAG: hypothetical protein USCGTAYLOR_00965 [Chromatiales bacterium USCg_Taylor]